MKKRDYSKNVTVRLVLAGISKTEAARRIGCKPQQITDVIKGRRPTPYIRQGLANMLNCEIADIFD